jgi:hypothetical protein
METACTLFSVTLATFTFLPALVCNPNVFSLLEASRAKANVVNEQTGKFIYPSYVEDIMGDIFSLGYVSFLSPSSCSSLLTILGSVLFAGYALLEMKRT